MPPQHCRHTAAHSCSSSRSVMPGHSLHCTHGIASRSIGHLSEVGEERRPPRLHADAHPRAARHQVSAAQDSLSRPPKSGWAGWASDVGWLQAWLVLPGGTRRQPPAGASGTPSSGCASHGAACPTAALSAAICCRGHGMLGTSGCISTLDGSHETIRIQEAERAYGGMLCGSGYPQDSDNLWPGASCRPLHQ